MKKQLILLFIFLGFLSKAISQLALDTTQDSHPIIVVQTKHYVTSWSQVASSTFDTVIVKSSAPFTDGYISFNGTAAHHRVLINEGGVVRLKATEFDDCSYLDIIGFGSSDPYGFTFGDGANPGFVMPINGKSHHIKLYGAILSNGINEGLTFKLANSDLQSKYQCDISYGYFQMKNLDVQYCKFRNNGGEDGYINSTGWYGRDLVSCPIADTGIERTGHYVNGQRVLFNTKDVLINGATVTNNATLPRLISTKYAKVDVNVEKVSGTLAGNIVISGSTNGTSYTVLSTLPITNTAGTKLYTVTYNPTSYTYFRVEATGSGTMQANVDSYITWYLVAIIQDSITWSHNVHINTGRSGVNFSAMNHAVFTFNKGWHVGRELNTQQGRLLACGGKVSGPIITDNKCFGSFNNNYWTNSEGNIIFDRNYGDSAGYWGKTKNTDATPSVHIEADGYGSATFKVRNNSMYHGTGGGSGSIQYAIYPWTDGRTTDTGNIICSNIGAILINDPLNYSADCSGSQNNPPVVNAGPNVNRDLPLQNFYKFINATATDDNGIASYLWSEISGPSFTIDNATILQPTVSNLLAGVYLFKFLVTDIKGASTADTIKITVNPPPNTPPVAEAGPAQAITQPTATVTMAGSGTDADGNATIVSKTWTQISGPSSTITDIHSYTTTITSMSTVGDYVYTLTVVDDKGAQATDNVTITVNAAPPPNQPPIANAGNDQTKTLPTSTANLSSTGSVDNDGNIVGYAWTQVVGPITATISTPSNSSTSISGMTTAGVYTFRLTVTDDDGDIGTDDVKITINPAPNVKPVANAGVNQTIQLPQSTITLNGSGSSDDVGITSYAWSKKSGPAATITSTSSATTTVTGITAIGDYIFRLIVTDGGGLKDTDNVKITVLAAANIAPVVEAGSPETITLPTTTVTLSGSATDDVSVASTLWENTDGCTIADETSLTTTATCTTAGIHDFTLIATDDQGAQSQDVKTATVLAASNTPPIAIAQSNISITIPPDSLVLNQDGSDADGIIVEYLSTVISSKMTPPGLSGANTKTPVLKGLQAGDTIYVQLRVRDDDGDYGYDTTIITVNASSINTSPIVVVKPDSVNDLKFPKNSISLDASSSFDRDVNDFVASYSWVYVSGDLTGATLSGAASSTFSLSGLKVGNYVFTLTITDSKGATTSATIRITVNDKFNHNPK